MTDFSGGLARGYQAGRRLPAGTVTAWMRAVAAFVAVSGGPVLDLGAGTGRFSHALARHFSVPVVAVEPAPEMRERAASAAGSGVFVVGGRAEAIPCASHAFQAIWASQVVHHIGDFDRCAAEVRRTLAPGGRFIVRGAFHDAERPTLFHTYFPALVAFAEERAQALTALRRALRQAGLRREHHATVVQSSAPTLADFAAQVALRAHSPLRRLTDDQFAEGLEHLMRDAGRSPDAGPITSAMDLVVFSLTPGPPGPR
ncbi:methyltransferase domain-containing protein [Planomonospora sp. ID67723]|uniref:class I SAM-dependent methyltransferase n=1 Tax=Planomonospora sp. ID67723 TaxID=2738134 RepID=UPI0018C3CCB1|nr:class I SAM-dependent methyltransferase [Planomonospora sp. ID67723]MBG0829786.1 methyltransferase domain-containing protein [Planomonospora sp. ID67723]